MRVTRRCIVATTCSLVAALACGGGGDPTSPPITSVVVTPGSVPITGIGVTASLTASVLGPLGAPITNPRVTWVSENSAVATVAASGLTATVTSVTSGTAVIRATAGGLSGTTTVTVDAQVRAVHLAPATVTVRAAETSPLTATIDADPGLSRTITFSSSAPNVATVSPTGVVTGVAEGVATITARSQADPGKSATSVVTVTPAAIARVAVTVTPATIPVGQTAQATARLFDALDHELSGRTIAWATTNAAVASVSSTGLVTGVSRGGPVQVTATSEGQTASAPITVAGVVSVALSSHAETIAIGATKQLGAVVTVDPGIPNGVTWVSRSPAVASVSATGLVTGVVPGSAQIVATAVGDAGKRDSALVTIINPCATVTPYTLGATVQGEISETDCLGLNDTFEFQVATPTFFSATLTPATSIMGLWPVTGMAGLSASAISGITVYALIPAGTNRLMVSGDASAPRPSAYSLTTRVNPTFDCGILVPAFGVSRTLALSDACRSFFPQGLSGAFVAQEVYMMLQPGRTLRITATAASFASRIELRSGVDVLASGAAAAAGGTATLTYTPNQVVYPAVIYLSSQTPGARGAFAFTVDP